MAKTRENWHHIRDCFEQILDLPPEERTEFLGRLPGEVRPDVERLLNWHEEAEGFLDRPASLRSVAPAEPSLPMELGPYRLLEVLGRGGMGTVYRAERADDLYRKQVAIKLLSSGLQSGQLAARFYAERQILAELDHPNIAKLLDGGTAPDGRPYFVLELVEGEPIDRAAARSGRSVPERLRLFLKVAAAVQFAHRHLVIHRDLKPGNVLITAEGEPKLLDFGIAKLLDGGPLGRGVAVTETGLAPLTPEYASPEQISGKAVSVSTDVYSLGVLLFELLTGRRPYDLSGAGLDEVVKAICEREAPLPSEVAEPRLARRLTGDLDNIVHMALRKEPERRYASVELFALDVENHLQGLPVRARIDTFGYRAGKFVLRHRWASAVALLAFLTLSGFTAVLYAQRTQLIRQRNRAETVSNVLTQTFSIADPTRSRGQQVTARELLDSAIEHVNVSLASQPEVQADLLLTVGKTYRNLGLIPESLGLARRGVAARERLFGEAHPELAEALDELAEVALIEAQYREAEEAARRSLAILQRLRMPKDSAVPARLARALEFQGRYDEAGELYEEALRLARAASAPETLAAVLERSAGLERKRDRPEVAESLLREALAAERRALGNDHPAVVRTLNELGLLLLWRGGRLAEAEAAFLEAQRIEEKLYLEPHPHLALTLNHLGQLRREQGRLAEAEALLRRSITVAREAYGGDHPAVAATLLNLGSLLQRSGRAAEAESALRDAAAIARTLLPARHPDLATALLSLAEFNAHQGKFAEAEALYLEVLAMQREGLGERHSQVGVTLNNLADLRMRQGDRAGARELLRQAVAIARESRARPQDLAGALHNLGGLERAAGDSEKARLAYAEALDLLLPTLGEEHVNVAMVRLALADLTIESGRPVEAEALIRQALPILSKAFPADDPWLKTAHLFLERSLKAQQQLLGSSPREP